MRRSEHLYGASVRLGGQMRRRVLAGVLAYGAGYGERVVDLLRPGYAGRLLVYRAEGTCLVDDLRHTS